MLWQRVLTAAVGIPIALLLVYLGGWYLAAAVALLAIAGLREFYGLATLLGRNARPAPSPPADAARGGRWRRAERFAVRAMLVQQIVGYVAAVLAPLACRGSADASLAETMLALAAAFAVALALSIWMKGASPPSIARFFGISLGAVSLPALFSYLLLLRELGGAAVVLPGLQVSLAPGVCWLFLALAACWAADSAAYGVGRVWGRHKLWPAVSPGKTIEGSVGGMAASILVVAGLGHWLGLGVGHGMLLGAILGVTGQLGDLAESMLKREAGVKDSGAILPGHGGVLDRFDSLLFNAPVAFYYLYFFIVA